ncbi:hypothetical protein [Streptosporangium sp. G12]
MRPAASLDGIHRAAKLADMMSVTQLDQWDAHVASIADVAVCPILTLDAAKWVQPSSALDNPLHIIEIAAPDR